MPVYRARQADSLRRLASLKLETGDAAGAITDAGQTITILESLPLRGGWEWFNLACADATLLAAADRDGARAVGGACAGAGRPGDERAPPVRRGGLPRLGRLSSRAGARPAPRADDFQLHLMDLSMPAERIRHGPLTTLNFETLEMFFARQARFFALDIATNRHSGISICLWIRCRTRRCRSSWCWSPARPWR